jgi:hypothetical protein
LSTPESPRPRQGAHRCRPATVESLSAHTGANALAFCLYGQHFRRDPPSARPEATRQSFEVPFTQYESLPRHIRPAEVARIPTKSPHLADIHAEAKLSETCGQRRHNGTRLGRSDALFRARSNAHGCCVHYDLLSSHNANGEPQFASLSGYWPRFHQRGRGYRGRNRTSGSAFRVGKTGKDEARLHLGRGSISTRPRPCVGLFGRGAEEPDVCLNA